MVELVSTRLSTQGIELYQNEERAVLAKRILASKTRLRELIRCMVNDKISNTDNLKQLRTDLFEYTRDVKFKRAKSMGQIVRTAVEFVRRNYEDVSLKRLMEQ